MTLPRVFVSHTSIDQSDPDYRFTMQLIEDLRTHGAEVVTSISSTSDDEFIRHLNHVLPSCQWFIVILTPEALQSLRVQMEVHIAINLVVQKSMFGVLAVGSAQYDEQGLPPTWTSIKLFDATQDYQRALAGMLMELGLDKQNIHALQNISQSSPTSTPTLKKPAIDLPSDSLIRMNAGYMDDRPADLAILLEAGRKRATTLEKPDDIPIDFPSPTQFKKQSRHLRQAVFIIPVVLLLILASVAAISKFSQMPSSNPTSRTIIVSTNVATSSTTNVDATTTALAITTANARATVDAKATAINGKNAAAPAIANHQITPAADTLTVQFTSIPQQVINGSSVSVGVNTSEPGATVILVVRYSNQGGRSTAGPQVSGSNGNATIPWFVFTFGFGQNSVLAVVYAVATDQNGLQTRSQTVTVQILTRGN